MRLVLLASYFLFTPIFTLSLIFYQLSIYHQNSRASARVLGAQKSSVEYKAIPQTLVGMKIELSSREARVEALKEFFARYKSPLLEHTESIVEKADKYRLDYRLLPAIAMQESTLCLKAPKETNNCWGFGIYGKKVTAFDNLEQAIEIVSKTLAEKYHAQGLSDPYEIMTKYAPSNSGEWAENVSYVMTRIAASL